MSYIRYYLKIYLKAGCKISIMFVRKANSIIRDLKNILALLNLEEGVD
jgi:hypothetical protein